MVGVIILASISYISFLKNIKFITKLNSIIVPILIFVIIFIGSKNIINLENVEKIYLQHNISSILQAIIYTSYNLLLVIPVLINLKNYLKNRKQIFIVSVSTGIIICIISILTFLLLVNVDTDFSKLEMPIIYVIQKRFIEFKYIYGITILIAIFTTAISVGISFLNNISKNSETFPQYVAILCITSIIISPIGFSNLVKILFPLFGYLGLIQIYFIVKNKNY